MASGQIKRSEIAEADLYKDIRNSAKKTITMLNKMNVQLKKTATTVRTDLDGAMQKTTAGILKMQTAIAKADTTMKKSVELDKSKAQATKAKIQAERELEKLAQDKQKTEQANLKTQQAKGREDQKQIANAKKKAKATADENNAYKKLVKTTRDQKNESKRLGAEMLKLESAGRKNTKQYRKLAQSFNSVTASAKRGDRQLKKLDKRVGDNFRNVGNYRSALGKLSGAFASLGLAMGGAMIIRNVFGVVKDFDQAQANLASVLGVSRIEMQGLTEDAKKLGATTVFTASQVSELQLSFAKLGFTQSEIRNVTEATLSLASATGTDLAEASTVVGSTVRAFGLDTMETQRVVDVMANSFSKSSLDMSKFATAMSNVAPVAKNAGRSVEETTALIATLTDRGVDASTAGTGLRNVFLELTKNGLTFGEAMQMISESTDKNKTALELFGKRGAVVGTILAENTHITAELTEKLLESAGASEKMALTQIDTLGGSLKLLQSAWEGWILKTNEAGGAGEGLKEIIQTLADNLEWILDTIVKVGKVWLTYKAITLLQVGANKLLATSFMQGIKGMGGFKGAIMGIKGAMMSLGNVIKQNLIGIALFVIIDMIAEYQKIQGILETVDENAEHLAETLGTLKTKGKEEEKQVNLLFGALAKTNPESEERLNLMNKINSVYGTSLVNLKDEIEYQKQLAVAQQAVIANIKEKTKSEGLRITYELAVKEEARSRFEVEKAERALEDFQDKGIGNDILTALFDKFGVTSQNDLIEVLNAWYKVDAQNRTILSKAEKAWNDMQISFATAKSPQQTACETGGGTWNNITKTCTPAGGGGGGGGGGGTTPDRVSLLRQIEDEEIKQIKDGLARELKKVRTDAKRRKIDLGDVNAYNSEKRKLRKEIDETLIDQETKINAKYDKLETQRKLKSIQNLKTFGLAQVSLQLNGVKDTLKNIDVRENLMQTADDTRIKALKDTFEIQKNNTELSNEELKKLEAEYLLEVDDIIIAGQMRRLANQNKYLLEVEKNFTKAEKDKRLELLKSNATMEEIDKAFLKFQIEQLEQLIIDKQKLGAETIDDEIKLEELKRKKLEVAGKLVIDDEKKLANEQLQIVQSVTEATIMLIDRRIAKIDEEIEKQEEKYSRYAELARNGNINAQQSLAVEAKLIAEANRKKEKLEKQKQRVQLAGDALQAYMRNSEDPDVKNPLLKTFTDITLLTQFIQNLPFFEDGTEDTGKTGSGVDGRGGFHAILHPNERVLTKGQNAMIGDMSNDDLAQMALRHKTNSLVDPNAIKVKTSGETQLVVDSLKSLEKTIKNKPETNIEFERIIDGAMQVVRKTKEGNTTIYNRYRTQK